jgi:hypothetical protein
MKLKIESQYSQKAMYTACVLHVLSLDNDPRQLKYVASINTKTWLCQQLPADVLTHCIPIFNVSDECTIHETQFSCCIVIHWDV